MKFIKIIPMVLALALMLTACNETADTAASVDTTTQKTTEQKTVETTPAIVQIDCFEGVEITLSGISPNGKLTINKENASQDIRKWVDFSSDLSSGIHNGDTIVVTASYDDGAVQYQQKKVIKADLSFYITDITGYDLSEVNALLDEGIQQTINMFGFNKDYIINQTSSKYLNIESSDFSGSFWYPNSSSYEPVADYFAFTENEGNWYGRVFKIKINATMSYLNIESMQQEIGETADFELYMYVDKRDLIDNEGNIQTDNKPYLVTAKEKRYNSLEEFEEELFEITPYESCKRLNTI
jgi:hypothetical protein